MRSALPSASPKYVWASADLCVDDILAALLF
jgi:hypothetical protein